MLCGVFVLSFQVVRILLVFAVLLFLNATADMLRGASGSSWTGLRPDLHRLIMFRELRIRLLLVYLILPIIFLFLEVVLDGELVWFKLLWRESLELFMVLSLIWRLLPTTAYRSTLRAPPRRPPTRARLLRALLPLPARLDDQRSALRCRCRGARRGDAARSAALSTGAPKESH